MSVPTYQSNQNLVLNNAFGSNLNNSTVLSSFPVSTTTSEGHYHFTDSTTNSLKLLNCSNDKTGGHQFWNSNSTQQPELLFNITREAVFLNSLLKNLTNQVNVDMVNNIITVRNSAQAYETVLQSSGTTIRNNATSEGVLLATNRLLVGNDITSEFSTVNNVSFSVANTTNNSRLTATDLVFNSTYSVLTEIEKLQIKQTNVLNVYPAPPIYADGRQPSAVPLSSSNTYAQFGWYFKNTVLGYKINWYFAPDNNQTVGDVLGLYLRLFNCGTTSNDNTPFLIIYTKPTGSGDYASWFHSSMVYILDQTITPTVNTSYTFFKNVSGTCPDPKHYASTLANMIQSPVNNPRGTYLPSEQILTIAIGSNSASAVNSVEFIGQKLGLMTSSGTQEFQLGFQL